MERLTVVGGWQRILSGLMALVVASLAARTLGDDPDAHVATRVRAPRTVEDLRELEQAMRGITEKIFAATVAVQVDSAHGSGVIINDQGYVLTAAHVAREPHRRAIVRLADGRSAQAETLGMNEKLDAGMVRIVDEGPWPYAAFGRSSTLRPGQWCVAAGYPGGFEGRRKPVLRLGRILKVDNSAILTDCTLVGGDSGGPLFDLNGAVIGVHSRIGKSLAVNVHVPADPYRQNWDRLVRGEAWDLLEAQVSKTTAGAWIGVSEDRSSPRAKVMRVSDGSPAAEAGIQPGDVIIEFGGVPIDRFAALQEAVRQRRPGEAVLVRVERNGITHQLTVRVGSRAERVRSSADSDARSDDS